MRVAMQTEIRLQVFDAHALAAVVHAPVAAARGNAHAVHFNHQIGAGPAAFDRTDRSRIQRLRLASAPMRLIHIGSFSPGSRRFGVLSSIWRIPPWRLIDQRQRLIVRPAGQHLHAAQVAVGVEERSLVAHLAHAELDFCRAHLARQRKFSIMQRRLAVAIRPPQPRMLHLELRELAGSRRITVSPG